MIRHLMRVLAAVLVLLWPVALFAQEIAAGRLTMDVEPTPLEEVLEGIADAAGLDLKVRGDLGDAVAQRLDDVPLETAIRRLAGPHLLVMVHDEGGSLRGVRVYAASGDPEERRAELAERARAVKAAQREAASEQPEDESDRGARVGVVRELARQGGPEAIQELGDLLANDADSAVRRLAAGALAGIGGEAAVDNLAGALGDQDRSVRLQALRGLYGVLREEAAPYLEQVVRNEADPGLRLMALQMARDLPDQRAGEIYQEALDDPDAEVRAAAEAALAR